MPDRCRTGALALGWAGVVLLLCPEVGAQGSPQPNPNMSQPNTPAGGIQAGGLAPPSPMGGTTTQPNTLSPTEAQLRKAQSEDTGRGLQWFYVQAEGGIEAVGLQTFKSNGLTYGSVGSTGFGPMYGIGLGLRVLVFTAGARFRTGNFADYNVNTLNAEGGMRIPLGNLEPYVSLGGGYAFLSGLNSDRWGAGTGAIRGFDVRAGAGIDYFISSTFSVGANLSGEMLALYRAASSSTPPLPNASAMAAKGSSVGSAVTFAGVLGLHF